MRLGIVPLTVISIALIPAYCKGGEVSKAKGRKVVSIRAVMLEFEKVAVEMPQNVDVLGNQGPSWGFSPEHKALERRIRLGNETRSLVVVFDSSTTTPKAIGAIVRIEKPGETAQDRRFRDFKVNREGTLERVIDSTGKYDEQGADHWFWRRHGLRSCNHS
jgi:hypothetical protein